MDAYKVMSLIDEAGELIAEGHGMNVTYCESMDMSLFPIVVSVIEDEYDKDESEGVLGDLHFLSENGRLIPRGYENATYEEIQAYLIENKDEVFDEIARDCKGYIEEYSEWEDEDEDEEDEEEE